MTVPALLVLLAAAPIVGPELEPDPPPRSEGVPAAHARLAGPDGGLVLIWGESRFANEGLHRIGRFDPAGGVLDPFGVPLLPAGARANALQGSGPSALACDGPTCLDVWTAAPSELVAARFDAGARPLDALPLRLDPGPVFDFASSGGGGTFLVTWSTEQAPVHEIRALRLASDGTLLDPAPLVLGTTTGRPSIGAAFGGGTHLVEWVADGVVTIAVVPGAGPPGAATPVASGAVVGAAVASDGAGFLVAWRREVGVQEVLPVSAAGVATGSAVTLVASDGLPALAGSAGVYLAAVSVAGRLQAIALAPDGTARGPAVDLAEAWGAASVATAPGLFAVVASPSSAIGPEVHLLDSTGQLISTQAAVLQGSSTQTEVELAPAGAGFALALAEVGGTTSSIRALHLDPRGVALPPGATTMGEIPVPSWPTVDLAAQPTSALVGWRERTALPDRSRARRLEPGGRLPLPGPDLEVQGDLALASDGTDFLVVSGGPGLPAVRITPAGELLDDPPLELRPLSSGLEPSASFGGGVYLVAYYPDSDFDTLAVNRVDPAGVVLDPGGTVVAVAITPWVQPPVICFDGTRFVIAWTEGIAQGDHDVYAVRVLPDGTLLDPAPLVLVSTPAEEFVQGLAFDGRAFLLLYGQALPGQQEHTLQGLRLDPELRPIDPASFELARGVSFQDQADAATLAPGEFLVAFSRNLLEAPYGTTRVRVRMVTALERGAPCDHPADCLTGACVAGSCCDRACDGACEACTIATGAAQDGSCGPVTDARVCRPGAGACDVEERCDGIADCPGDRLATRSVVCRPPAAPCDVEERCTGTSTDCGEDLRSGPGQPCRPAEGGCDLEERCDGVGLACPEDLLRPDRAHCREAAGACDVVERCDGASKQCPEDLRQADSWACRPTEGVCDPEERCDGLSVDCPADALDAGTICRSSEGRCDPEERCDGAAPACGPDLRIETRGPCDDADPLTTGESCTAGGSCEGGVAAGTEPAPSAPAESGCGCDAGTGASLAWLATGAILCCWNRRRQPYAAR